MPPQRQHLQGLELRQEPTRSQRKSEPARSSFRRQTEPYPTIQPPVRGSSAFSSNHGALNARYETASCPGNSLGHVGSPQHHYTNSNGTRVAHTHTSVAAPWMEPHFGPVDGQIHSLLDPRSPHFHGDRHCIDPRCIMLPAQQTQHALLQWDSRDSHQNPSIHLVAPSTTVSAPGLVYSPYNPSPPFSGQPFQSSVRESQRHCPSQDHDLRSHGASQVDNQEVLGEIRAESSMNFFDIPPPASEYCPPGCYDHCDTASEVCEKPNRCDSPASDCLEPCPGGIEDCDKRNKCNSEECEVQMGFCQEPDLDDLEEFLAIYNQGASAYNHSYQVADEESICRVPHVDANLTSRQRPSSMDTTPTLSSTEEHSIDFSDIPEQDEPGLSTPGSDHLRRQAMSTIPLTVMNREASSGVNHRIELECQRRLQQMTVMDPMNRMASQPSSSSGLHGTSCSSILNDQTTSLKRQGEGFLFTDQAVRPTKEQQFSPRNHRAVSLPCDQPLLLQCQWITDRKICSQWFRDSDSLQGHWLISHKGEGSRCRWQGCPNADFQKMDRLTRHMHRHTGHKAAQCEECGQLFSTKQNLEQHCKTVHGKKKEQCHQCGKLYASKSILKQHMLKHDGKQPYKCKYCGRIDSDGSNMRKHIQGQWILFQQITIFGLQHVL